MKRICVNCGSSPGNDPSYLAAARNLGETLVERKIDLVYGGANIGLMGEVADTVMRGNRAAIGVIPQLLADRVSHNGLTELIVVDTMHERKAKMFELSDGFVVLPGGFGTIEELTELLTWAQLGYHEKPIGLLNVAGYYDSLLGFFRESVEHGFLKREHHDMLQVADDPAILLDKFALYEAPKLGKWFGKDS